MPKISSVGYNFQVDLTWQALQQGFTVAEVPIEFVERERGQSKMNSRIVVEALFRTTAWGIRYRLSQLKNLVVRGNKAGS
jgi:dolichol-phosphate mannosyltransferase